MKGIYIHIPFCVKKCFYCDFTSYCGQAEGTVEDYIEALKNEALIAGRSNCGHGGLTAYVGGGTPSLLSEEQIASLSGALGAFGSSFSEVTFECNPESGGTEKFHTMRGIGVNRLSFGVQSFDDTELAALGRIHNSRQALEKFEEARRTGLENINLDLMYGIPGQTTESWAATLNTAVSLSPEHISLYPLVIEEGTPFCENGVETDGDIQSEMYYAACERLAGAGYSRYEISNFALPGKECRHNLNYWHNGEYQGLGVAAVSYVSGVRSKNACSLEDYVAAVGNGRRPEVERDELFGKQRSAERIMLALRTSEGVSIRCGEEDFLPSLESNRAQGLIERREDGVWRLTDNGVYLSNVVFRSLL